MHEVFNGFPLECSFKQKVHKKYSLKEGKVVRGEKGEGGYRFMVIPKRLISHEFIHKLGIKEEDLEVVISADNTSEYETYNVFDRDDLLTSLYDLVKGVKSGKDLNTSILKWVTKNGLLGVGQDSTTNMEALNDFWREATQIYDLWDRYRQVVQRDINKLKDWIEFVPHDDPLFFPDYKTRVLYDRVPYKDSNGAIFDFADDKYVKPTINEILKDPLNYYQFSAIAYIFDKVKSKLENLSLGFSKVSKKANKSKMLEDYVEFTPILTPHTMLEALYLQFYILLSNRNMKICENCGKPFPVYLNDKRLINKIYCTEACKNRGKSRRYRSRKKGVSNLT